LTVWEEQCFIIAMASICLSNLGR